MSSIVNKVKDVLHKDDDKKSDPAGTHGPHETRTANTADPRVDSDRDGRAANTGLAGTTGNTGTYGANTTGSTGLGGDNFTASGTGVTGAPGGTSTTGTGYTGTTGSSNRGPHDSNMMNKADPRVDSDRDGRAANTGLSGTTGTTGAYGTTTGSSGLTGSSGVGSTNRGPHDSNAMNKADPRVDSDRDGRAAPGSEFGSSRTTGTTGMTGTGGEFGSSRTAGTGGEFGSATTGAGMTGTGAGYNAGSTTAGTTGSGYNTRSTGTTGTGIGNEYGSSTTTGTSGTTGLTGSSNPGPAPNTAGPHKQDMLNKADPRVDSNLDGSKTVGGDKTYQSRDPTDAAQVPPSVMAKNIGGPVQEHDDHSHDRLRRNSKATHQEAHTGL